MRVAIAVVAAVVFTSGIAWAAGALSPLDLFQSNPEDDGSAPAGLWDQHVVSSSVTQVGSVDVPKAGSVAFWYGRSAEGGWCAALRLPSGDWLGTGKDKLDGGGTVPGCFPTREAVNGASTKPVYVIDGFDNIEDDVDTRSNGGSFWRIYYGRITAEDAVRVTDLTSGRSTSVVRNGPLHARRPGSRPGASERPASRRLRKRRANRRRRLSDLPNALTRRLRCSASGVEPSWPE